MRSYENKWGAVNVIEGGEHRLGPNGLVGGLLEMRYQGSTGGVVKIERVATQIRSKITTDYSFLYLQTIYKGLYYN